MSFSESYITSVVAFWEQHEHFLVTTHQSADGDAYGAVLAVAGLVFGAGKTCDIIIHDPEPDVRYRFLDFWDIIKPEKDISSAEYEAAIVLDTPSTSRAGDVARLFPAPQNCLQIDHHPEEDEFAKIRIVDVQASSTCVILFELVRKLGWEITPAIAQAMFTGIMYDTGRFSFTNVSQRDFSIAAKLVDLGADAARVADNMLFQNRVDVLQLIGLGLHRIAMHLQNTVCVITLPWEAIGDISDGELDLLAEFSLAIGGVEVGLFLRHVEECLVKVSLRSRGKVDVSIIASTFGGGGHRHAAGFRIKYSTNEILPLILSEIDKQL